MVFINLDIEFIDVYEIFWVFKKIKILLPPLSEQQKIASILSNVDTKIQSKEQYKEKLQRVKKSLMQKLLTGEVRVAV